MKVLIAGPWQGEFGWELMCWQGLLRQAAFKNALRGNCNKKDRYFDKVVVGCQPGHEILYMDFADEFIPVPPGRQPEGWNDGKSNPKWDPKVLESIKEQYKDDELFWYMPNAKNCNWRDKQRFIHFGTKGDKYDVIFHARDTSKNNSGRRNWDISKFNAVARFLRGKRMASIGAHGKSLCVEGTEDLRGKPLDELILALAAAKIVVGPSSGPMHLATLCRTPQLVWTDNRVWRSVGATNRRRYEELWNPFKVKTIILDDCDWQPAASYVGETLKEFLKKY